MDNPTIYKPINMRCEYPLFLEAFNLGTEWEDIQIISTLQKAIVEKTIEEGVMFETTSVKKFDLNESYYFVLLSDGRISTMAKNGLSRYKELKDEI